MLQFLSAIGGILLIDIVLSGDNALVIGAAAAGLPPKERKLAILAGGGGAIVLRIVFAILASYLLLLPWLQAIGGLVLLFIAVRLLTDRQHKESPHEGETPDTAPKKAKGFLSALLTILIADVTMSLDNVLAVGALAHGDIVALTIGILLSLVLVLIGSAVVATLIKWLPWLLDVAALVLAWTSAGMLLHDKQLGMLLGHETWVTVTIYAVCLAVVAIADVILLARAWRNRKAIPAPVASSVPTETVQR